MEQTIVLHVDKNLGKTKVTLNTFWVRSSQKMGMAFLEYGILKTAVFQESYLY